ncbi:hypothetical protein [uncultured Rubinisphaera sp.]|uniref:hypothetical protein n=1 Tax=uncultured Rubinisphaera sp. TaxID=1678686 RepID=UPI000EE0DEAC|nr:hypothetical protein [Planctomycetaceae bacterium]|tara:strand:- start:379 stop:1029 length:651 start_codon:yes stop_codon:yes gene_type:complete
MSSSYNSVFNNILLAGLILITGGAWSYLMFGSSRELPINKSRAVSEIEDRLQDHLPAIQDATQKLVTEVSEPIGKAFYKQIQEDDSRYLKTVQIQGAEYGQNVEKLFIKAAQNQYRDYWQAHRKVLAEEFPEYADKEALDELIAEFERTSDKLIERYYADEFIEEGKTTAEYWSRFEPIEVPEDAQVDLEGQLLDYVADWTVLAFTDESSDQLGLD